MCVLSQKNCYVFKLHTQDDDDDDVCAVYKDFRSVICVQRAVLSQSCVQLFVVYPY